MIVKKYEKNNILIVLKLKEGLKIIIPLKFTLNKKKHENVIKFI